MFANYYKYKYYYCYFQSKEICSKDEFMCADETCIPVEYRCDGIFADCDGGEDEQECGWYNAVGITDQYFSTCLSIHTCMMIGPVFVVLIIHRQLQDDRNRLDLK